MKRIEAETRKRDIVKYQKQITTDDTSAYVEITLLFEGLQEKRIAELRGMFNVFFSKVEEVVKEDIRFAADLKQVLAGF